MKITKLKIKNFFKVYWKLLVPFFFILALLLGLAQRKPQTHVYNFTDPEKLQRELAGFYTRGNELSPRNQTKTTVTFLAAGDIMLSRNVAGTIQKSGDPLLPFKGMESILKSTNFNFANLESPVSGNDFFNPSGSMVFNAPPAYTKGLTEYNFKILNLANNHAFDQGLKGLQYTDKFLDNLGIKHIGTGNNLDEAWKPEIISANGLQTCFIGASYASVNDSGKEKNNYVARIEDTERLKVSITLARQECDFVVVTMHAGTEYTRDPNEEQMDFAHTAIDYGADMVIGAHPHWVQTTENYKGKYIFYSLGNFIFDQEWSQETKEGLTLKITISKNKVGNAATPGAATLDDLQGARTPAQLQSIELIPVIIENYSTPRPANTDESKKILEKIGITTSALK